MTPSQESLTQIRKQVVLAIDSLSKPAADPARLMLLEARDLLVNFDRLESAALLLGDADTLLQSRPGTSRAMCAIRYAAVLVADLIKTQAHKAA